jgi:beta-alanine--pyruvate transaminase
MQETLEKAAVALQAELNLEPFWMPFTANRQFKANPRLLVAARDMYYTSHDGRQILDGTAGLWCVNAGHCRLPIVEAIQQQVAQLDYAPAFQMGHPKAFQLAEQLIQLTPAGLDHVFFTNSGSEAVDTALKMAIAYHRIRGQGSRQRLIGRERGYHGVGFGGISVGGISNNRKFFGSLIPGVDHLPHTHNLEQNAFSRGLPRWGSHLAEDLERIVALHDASTIAAVIVEPVAGSTGVLLPPVGYLEKLRAICDKYGILLIFDEVITGFGRLGSPFAANYFGVVPDLICCAKGLTNGTIPMGAVIVKQEIYSAFMEAAGSADDLHRPGDNSRTLSWSPIEFFHGYTYSGHPVASAAGLATLNLYREEGLFERAANLAPLWEEALHSLRGLPHVIDVRNLGLVGAIELEGIPGRPTARAFEAFLRCYERGVLIRTTGDTIALSPPLIIEEAHIEHLIATLKRVLQELP